ncbi:MAG TPA: undecaprenyl-diphosphate phosphatase [Polyangiaceae bacterium]
MAISAMLDAFILGLVEGLTEFLPVSSTGHLLLAEHWLGTHRSEAFNVLIQVGPILAVTVVFWKSIATLLFGLKDPVVRDEFVKLAVCVGIIGVGGLLMKRLGLELPETARPVAWALLVGGLVIFGVEAVAKRRELDATVTWAAVFAVAAGQLLSAAFPGTSRSGAAIMAALLLGVTRPAAVRFAFLSGIPIMLAAGALELKHAAKAGELGQLMALDAGLAFVTATLVAWVSVVWLMRWVQVRDFRCFAWYRLILGAAILFGLAGA